MKTDLRYNDLKYCELSSLVYEDLTTNIQSQIMKEMNYKTVDFLDHDGAQAYVCTSDNEITFVFRGTEPDVASDVVADLKAWKQKSQVAGRVHDGFYGELEKLWDQIETYVDEHKGKVCTITGHSLGAAMATICAARLQGIFKSLTLYTFGSPRVGNRRFVNSLSFDHHRWVNNNDAVTKVPPSFLFFKHHGTLEYLNYYGNIRDGLSPWQRIKDGLRGRFTAFKKLQFFRGVYDHPIGEYEKKLASLDLKQKEMMEDLANTTRG